jgi:phage gp16-like protein
VTATPRRPTSPPDSSDAARRGAIAKIHIARAQLGMGDDAYRDMLERITGARTAGKLAMDQLDAVLAEMKRLGFRAQPAKRSTSPKAQVRMIFAVWKDLQPHLEDGSEAALRAFCARQTKSPKHPQGVSAPQFLGPTEANQVLEGLKAWLARCRTRARAQAEARAEGMGQ